MFPAVPTFGVKLEILGAEDPSVTLKLFVLVALPKGEVTLVGPVVAPVGTLATI